MLNALTALATTALNLSMSEQAALVLLLKTATAAHVMTFCKLISALLTRSRRKTCDAALTTTTC